MIGSYQRGDPIDDSSAGAGGEAGEAGGGAVVNEPPDAASTGPCGATLVGVVRDFKGANEPGGHPDFEIFMGGDPSLGIVLPDLGADRKPVYSAAPDSPFIDVSVNGDGANGQQTTNKANFDQWYRNAPGVNKAYQVFLDSVPNGALRTFATDAYFPLDGAGWGHTPGLTHNFSFTTEVHAKLNYRAGAVFTLTGDDDLWLFVNHKLIIDLGGVHMQSTKSISLDAVAADIGIKVGESYDFDLFHAERHSGGSTLRMDTNIEFSDCATMLPDPPG